MIGAILVSAIGYGVAILFMIAGAWCLLDASKSTAATRDKERTSGFVGLALAFLIAAVTRSVLGGAL